MPKLTKKFPDLKLVLTGGGYNKKHNWLINLGVIQKNYLVKLLKNSQLILTPIYEGYGSRIKIIEALMLGVPVISSPKGIEGIDYKADTNRGPLVHENKKKLLKYTLNVLKNNQLYKKYSSQNKKKYIAIYSMEEIVKKFQIFLKKFKMISQILRYCSTLLSFFFKNDLKPLQTKHKFVSKILKKKLNEFSFVKTSKLKIHKIFSKKVYDLIIENKTINFLRNTHVQNIFFCSQ